MGVGGTPRVTQEEQLLVRVSCAAKGKKWKQASRELREHGFDRSDAECRERYAERHAVS